MNENIVVLQYIYKHTYTVISKPVITIRHICEIGSFHLYQHAAADGGIPYLKNHCLKTNVYLH